MMKTKEEYDNQEADDSERKVEIDDDTQIFKQNFLSFYGSWDTIEKVPGMNSCGLPVKCGGAIE
jgi:hypothetical protein